MSSQAIAAVDWEDPKLLDTIKQTVCKGATDAQFNMFLHICRATGLNPFLKEIYYAPQIGVMASRDGYLRKANDHPQFDGMETRVERNDQNVPIKATCSVWRKDRGHPVICEAYYSEYKKDSDVWRKYPSAMIAKVAEVLALKRSFAINGVVTEEEIGEQGSKEAQADYLRSKGIDPAIPPKHQHHQPPPDVRNASEQHKALIVETAKMLDEPPQPSFEQAQEEWRKGGKTLEMRHAATVAETDAVLKEVAKPPARRKKGAVSFDVLKHFGTIKQELRSDTGTDAMYYQTLNDYGFTHADEITSDSKAREIYRTLAQKHKHMSVEKDLLATLEHASEVIGVREFSNILGAHGAETIADALKLEGDPLGFLLTDLKAHVDQRKGQA